MTNLIPTPVLSSVVQLETSDRNLAGPGGPLNLQAQALLNRTEFLRLTDSSLQNQIDSLSSVSAVELRNDLASSVGSTNIGNGIRTQFQKNADILSVRDFITTPVDGTYDNQEGIVAAISAAIATGSNLLWPAGTYVSSANIPNFHSVSHIGKGVIKRGVNLFKITPSANEANTIYVSQGGSPINDGITSTTATNSMQNAFVALTNYGPMLPGNWTIAVLPGTTTGGATYPEGLEAAGRVIIMGEAVGSSPSIPTSIIDGAGTQSFGFNCNGDGKVLIRDIKFQNFQNYGIVTQDLCDVYCVNVHTDNIIGGRGIGMLFQQGRYRVYGGVISNSGTYGIEFISQATVSVGSLTNDLAGGVRITNSGVASCLAQEGATGHFDYVTTDTAPIAVDIVQNSRLNSTGCSFNNHPVGIRARNASNWLDNGATNTFTAVTVRQKFYSFSGETDSINQRVTASCSRMDTATVTHTGTTASTALKTYAAEIKRNTFDWEGRSLRVLVTGQFLGGAAAKTLQVYLGGNLVAGLVSITSSTGFFKFEASLYAISSSSQKYHVFMLDSANQGSFPVSPCKGDSGSRAYSLNTGADLTLQVNGTLGNAADSIVINTVEVWQTGG